ncbi:hypothetical protein Mal64_31730 [Pseudobythopirellula maris]|uniref:Uncharacterized protein n=1 Tax=Pseudobythopirellula maris TaxID=2527991 RepID=A0A5C5ZLE1_9BACT|nr:hypothetical protein [Pseudobythopirellula maris]TWT87631.1 hypothetical protein Mal64_31730 [Pseudobythopirellula maris]
MATSPPRDGPIADDGRTLWASPTTGGPIRAEPLLPGCQIVLWFQPQAMSESPAGRRMLDALGPGLLGFLDALVGERRLDEVETLLVGVRPADAYGEFEATSRATFADAIEPELNAWPQQRAESLRAEADNEPLLGRELERLLMASDRDRCLTLLVEAGFLRGDGAALLRGELAPLGDALNMEIADDLRAASLSLHFDDRFYWELRLVAGDRTESQVRRDTAERVAAAPAEIGSLVDSGDWSRYARPLVTRFPAMAETAARYARFGVDGRVAVANGYLPPAAGHNLLLAARVASAERSAAGAESAASRPVLSLEQRLAGPVRMAVEREPLESALRVLADAVDAPVLIVGRDLQLKGVTRNQSVTLRADGLPAEAVLVELLRMANPDPLAAGPADPRQQLVHLLRDGAIVITTRDAARERGEPLPAVYRAAP